MITKNDRILVIDVETTNTITNSRGTLDMSDVLIYDCGWQVIDRLGNVYASASYINYDIFCGERALMKSAYYANKIPQYEDDLSEGRRKLATYNTILRELINTINKYQIRYFAAYNARFDYNALNRTVSWVTKSAKRYALPFGQIIWLDIMKMAQDAIVSTRNYKIWANDNEYTGKRGAPRKTAEIIYRYITGDKNFEESHTGLEDVEIETLIMMHCFAEAKRRHKKMRVLLWENQKEFPEHTQFQIELMTSIKRNPTINMGR